MSRDLHAHHDTYATILIAPSVRDSEKISAEINKDNVGRAINLIKHRVDPGRATGVDWSEVRISFCSRLSVR